jgi:hypothetical protein
MGSSGGRFCDLPGDALALPTCPPTTSLLPPVWSSSMPATTRTGCYCLRCSGWTAREWERAAIVSAFVTVGEHGVGVRQAGKTSSRLSEAG